MVSHCFLLHFLPEIAQPLLPHLKPLPFTVIQWSVVLTGFGTTTSYLRLMSHTGLYEQYNIVTTNCYSFNFVLFYIVRTHNIRVYLRQY